MLDAFRYDGARSFLRTSSFVKGVLWVNRMYRYYPVRGFLDGKSNIFW